MRHVSLSLCLHSHQACLAALDFIVTSSARYNVDDATLSLELQQLGLPKTNSNSLARGYRDGKERLRVALAAAVVRVRACAVASSRPAAGTTPCCDPGADASYCVSLFRSFQA